MEELWHWVFFLVIATLIFLTFRNYILEQQNDTLFEHDVYAKRIALDINALMSASNIDEISIYLDEDYKVEIKDEVEVWFQGIVTTYPYIKNDHFNLQYSQQDSQLIIRKIIK